MPARPTGSPWVFSVVNPMMLAASCPFGYTRVYDGVSATPGRLSAEMRAAVAAGTFCLSAT